LILNFGEKADETVRGIDAAAETPRSPLRLDHLIKGEFDEAVVMPAS
jgi:hypothetical protein